MQATQCSKTTMAAITAVLLVVDAAPTIQQGNESVMFKYGVVLYHHVAWLEESDGTEKESFSYTFYSHCV